MYTYMIMNILLQDSGLPAMSALKQRLNPFAIFADVVQVLEILEAKLA